MCVCGCIAGVERWSGGQGGVEGGERVLAGRWLGSRVGLGRQAGQRHTRVADVLRASTESQALVALVVTVDC